MNTRLVFAIQACMLLSVFFMSGNAVLAHHSRAHYGQEEMASKGIVAEYKWRNPHVFVVWDVKDQTGKTIQWVGEMTSVTSMFADGMTKDSLKPGDEITVLSFPSKVAGSTEALIKKITKADGTVVVDNWRVPNLRQP